MDKKKSLHRYPDARSVTAKLDELIRLPVYSISDQALENYERDYYGKKCAASKAQITKAREIIPGGVQHNLAFNYPFPLVFTRAKDHTLTDLDGNTYFDFLQSGGPTVLGSNPDAVREKVFELLETCGPSTGLFHEYEYLLGQKIVDSMPSVDMFRMYTSGTEACMVAARVARLATGKKNIVKMGGAYHGWSDQLAYSIRIPGTKGLQSPGIPGFVFKKTREFFPNDLNSLEAVLRKNRMRGGTAAVFIEPVGPESGTRPLDLGFNRGAEELCRQYGSLLVFDEVVTGFRLGMDGAQGYFGVSPDLTVFGKVIAGGYPGAGGVGGKHEVMRFLGAGLDGGGKKALSGGTLAANPLSCAAGYHTLCEIERTGACARANAMGDLLTDGLNDLIDRHQLPFVAYNIGSICHLNTLGTMHYAIRWSRPWTIPGILKETSIRKKEMERMGAAYMAEGLVTLAGSRLYVNATYTEETIREALARFDRVFQQVVKKDYGDHHGKKPGN
ncbi:MAG TPA: aminotransferase class III-fold pyridoxal phosphate-dependent enzyme [Bacillota bacterium]|jgi:glutamate-1-semialdehyde 2,1-aminomutase|nr:aminotransferase class III-fold pyridoxal phosphate-dependent enzyme [Fastidiosipila sp.]HPX92806.1 aminotransferase class III-fold pyridoxal phosphate-dependent enzyme [Bacillota bacterium]HQB81291.1 aminotransferase class III-fold pyridoxal phosphate-dependent enzyme [Bacillota bacterium]